MFDTYLEKISHKWIILNDLNLKHNKSFQIDSVLIGGQSIYPIDVKNFEHDYYMENGQWYHPNYPNDGKDLLLQLQRSKSLFQQLLTNLGYSNFTFISRLVFVNPTFTLYEAPRDLPAILPTQMNGFIENLGKQAVHVDFSHRKLADKLISMHRTKSEYSIIPAYDFESLEKGIFREKCRREWNWKEENL
ncbi:hypothetical protein J2S74_002777 [Evansella vedderi]|uniref:NERD domain-containing protein n=1 Tax=Evansella vedderi TaxID=38282 RepID=A0ABT9ZWR0_9BACI|nr:nuclease-related domain-containing protein [Evansella vedderi]MDQ0255395.1 hypothetical protein [Evansella vedderi]